MACNSNTSCPTHVNKCTCNAVGTNGSPCTANVTVWTDAIVNGAFATNITSAQIDELKTAISNEYARRKWVYENHVFELSDDKGYDVNVENNATKTPYPDGYVPPVYDGDTSQSSEITADSIEQLYQLISALKEMSWPSNVDEELNEEEIQAAQHIDLRNNINDCENDCLCNCDYCTCNCNYCTCDCNYCTCNCNYCTCNCNNCSCDCNIYTCPCNCNQDGGGTCTGRGCTAQGGW